MLGLQNGAPFTNPNMSDNHVSQNAVAYTPVLPTSRMGRWNPQPEPSVVPQPRERAPLCHWHIFHCTAAVRPAENLKAPLGNVTGGFLQQLSHSLI